MARSMTDPADAPLPSDDAPAMPGGGIDDGGDPPDRSPRPSFRRQVVQLFVVPALIVIAAGAIAYPIMRVFSVKGSAASYLATLGRRGGIANDKWRAIHGLNEHVQSLTDPAARAQLNAELLRILREADPGDDGRLMQGLILLIANLGQPGNLKVVLEYADSPHEPVRQGVVLSILQWRDREQGRVALPQLIEMTGDSDVHVRGYAAKALGRFATSSDAPVIEALQRMLNQATLDGREASWDAAIALGRFGDQQGSLIVASQLLDRAALAQLPADAAAARAGEKMPRGKQDQIILLTLDAAGEMTDSRVWDKISQLADNDVNPRVRIVARELLLKKHRREGPGPGPGAGGPRSPTRMKTDYTCLTKT